MSDTNYTHHDTTYHLHHECDTICDTTVIMTEQDTTYYITEIITDSELHIIEKLIDRPDFGKSVFSLIILFVILWAILKRSKGKKKKNG